MPHAQLPVAHASRRHRQQAQTVDVTVTNHRPNDYTVILQAHFFELFVFGEVGLLKQFFQTLSVAAMFCVQAIDLFAQRGILVLRPSSTPGSAVWLGDTCRRFY
jgi:hypothetical protein